MRAAWNRKRIGATVIVAVALLGGGIGLAIKHMENEDASGTKADPIREWTASASGPYLQTTLSLRDIDGAQVPFQNGIPVPTFDPQDRTVVGLDGEWRKIRFDADHDLTMAPRGEAWLEKLREQEAAYIDGSTADWEARAIPLPENALTGEAAPNAAETYENGVWYARTFDIGKLDKGKAYTLKALGISYVADVWINGQWIGFHEGGFTPFAFDLSPFLRDGENEIRIRVDNPPWGSRDETIPAVAGTDFFNYTGIVQELYVEKTDAAYISRADIVPLNAQGKVRLTAVLVNAGDRPFQGAFKGTFYEADRDSEAYLSSPLASGIIGPEAATDRSIDEPISLQPGETHVVTLETTIANAKPWAIGDPHLYVGKFLLASSGEDEAQGDTLTTQFGVRTVETAGTRIEVNGEPVFLAGIARHEEWPESGRTAAWERILSDLKQIQGQNANMVRTGHYPNHAYTYLLLDRLGLAAMSEIPLWQFETKHYEAQEERHFADQMWREMVFSQYNRPSVLLWSTQNESKEVKLRLAYNERLVQDLRDNYDDGRLITQSAAADQPGPEDPSMAPLDVAGWTMYFGVFHGGSPYEGTRIFLEKAHRAFPDKPILNTEFGHWTGDADAEAESQTHIYETTMQALLEKATRTSTGKPVAEGYVAGIDFWIMYDWYVNHNKWIDTFGLYRMDRTTGKPVAGQLPADYGRLIGANAGAEAEPKPLTTVSLDSADSSVRLPLGDARDWSGYAWLRVDAADKQSKLGYKVTIEDAGGRRWIYDSYEVFPNTSFPVYVPLWQANDVDLANVASVTVSREEPSEFSVLRAMLTDDATEGWQALTE